MLVYDYEIIYKQGSDISAANALYRVQGLALFQLSVSSIDPLLWPRIQESWVQDPNIHAKFIALQQGKVIHNM